MPNQRSLNQLGEHFYDENESQKPPTFQHYFKELLGLF